MKIFVQHFGGGIKYWLSRSGDKLSLDTDKKNAVDILASEAPSVARKLAAVVGKLPKLDGFSVYGESDKTKTKRKLRDNPRRPKAVARGPAPKKKAPGEKRSKPRKKVTGHLPAKKPKRCKK